MADHVRCSSVVALLFVLAIRPAVADQPVVKTPAEQLSYQPNHLDQMPKDWITTYPIQLDIAFNLRFAPDSPEAEAFLATWYRTIAKAPEPIRLEVLRIVAPTRFRYLVSMRFNNWREYRIYESGRVMLDYYYGTWKPAVTDSEERLSVIDPLGTRRATK